MNTFLGQYQAAINLANDLVAEHKNNFPAFSKQKIQQMLTKIR